MVGNVKPLYLANSIEDLQKQGKLGDVSKHKVKPLCESGDKVLKEATYTKEMGDEEKSYVLFFKYVELAKKIRQHPEYKKDEKYFDSMYNIKKNCKKAIDALEGLTENLDKRYNEKLKMETMREISEEVTMKKVNKSSKIKVDFNSNENLTSTPISGANGLRSREEPKVLKDYIVTHKKLHSIIQQKSTSFFILDTRSAEDYSMSHIDLPQSLNVSEQFLRPGTTAATIGKSLKIQERCQWERRTQQDMLIICDWTSEDFQPGAPVTVLRDALTKWDVGASHRNPPFLLEGGFEKFLFGYPQLVTNPKARAPLENRAITKIATRLDVDYPDLDSGFLITPSPSPKSLAAVKSGAITITKESPPVSGVRYPSLSSNDLNSLTPKSGSRSTTPSATNLRNQFTQPVIPDRSTKPVTSSDQSRDDFNDARNNFSLARTESGSSVASNFSSLSEAGNSNSVLNNGMLDSFKDLRLSNGLPKIDRESKKTALMKYYDVAKLDNMESVLEEELKVADQSLEREKEKLDLENKWEFLRREKEKQHEEAMRAEIMEEQEKLVKELDRLEEEKKEREESERKLLDELEKMKLLLKEKDDKVRSYQKNEEERRRKDVELREKRERKKQMLESVEEKRRERKRKEREARESRLSHSSYMNGHHEPSPEPSRGAAGVKKYLKDDGGGGGGLKRSFSSPNIAKMLEQEEGGVSPGVLGGANIGYSGSVPVPKFSRNNKPSLISARNFAGVWGTQKPGLTGLKNLGNTCYMNSILQCVSNTPPLAHYFVSRGFEEDVNDKFSKTRGHIASEFAEVLKTLWASQFKSISASDFKSRVGRYKSEFAGRDQQDSHEFLLSLLEWLHDDVNKVPRPSAMPEQNSKDKQDVAAARRHWINYLERNQSIIVQLFCGQTRSVVKCFLCQGESVTYREFTNLTLPLPEHSNRTSLRECMDLYLREERIDEFKCDICKQTGKVTKKTDIVKFPPLLIIHLSRFYQDGMYTRKKQNFVNFDLKNMNLSQMAVPGFDNKHTRFNLYAVSNHFGSLEGGHYTAYCSSDVLKKWYKFDDQDVSVMDAADVVTPAAYILFFTAIEGQTSLPPLG